MPPKDKPATKKPEPDKVKAGAAQPAAAEAAPAGPSPASTPPSKPGTKPNKPGTKPDKPGTKQDKPGTPQPSASAEEFPKELYCTPETCMYQPGPIRKFFGRHQEKLKYFMAVLLFGCLVAGLVVYILKCKNTKKTK